MKGPKKQGGDQIAIDPGFVLIGLGMLLEVLGIVPPVRGVIPGGIKFSGTVGAILIIIGALLYANVI